MQLLQFSNTQSFDPLINMHSNNIIASDYTMNTRITGGIYADLSRITKVFSETVFSQKTSSVPLIIRKLCTNIYLSAPSDYVLPEPSLPPNKKSILNTLGEPTLSSLGLHSY